MAMAAHQTGIIMKRFSLFVLAGATALAFSAAATSAQTIGFKLGASMSNLSIDGTTGDTDWSTGFVGGGFVRFGIGRLGIQPEVLSVTKGAEYDDEAGDEALNIEYVAVPVLLHLPLTASASFAPYIIAGPEFAFDIGCELTTEAGDFDCDADDFPDGPLDRKSIDIGLSAGGGLAFAMGPGALLLEGRYTWGMTNISESDASEIKNRSAYFLAGYSIPLGRGY
jgi:hypothetical protein